ncbi:unnamed protein product [Darwinula stevensoni]|uniref:Protein vein n=1 Tax=Darwinula stevensoni TaxID=69355 RepID=A0A7R9AD23_9CRUS|nr:unnamed protein product [Darwinula stevensoni]CAG0900911.1 unnamed protein product [Darwinula stevensoni]
MGVKSPWKQHPFLARVLFLRETLTRLIRSIRQIRPSRGIATFAKQLVGEAKLIKGADTRLRLSRRSYRDIFRSLPPACEGNRLSHLRCAKAGKAAEARIQGTGKNVTVRVSKKLRLRCKTKGLPTPEITWYKDGRPLSSNKRIVITTKRRKSRLVIQKAAPKDSGTYECRAWNAFGPPSVSTTHVLVKGKLEPKNDSNESPCEVAHFCLNGGTCTYIKDIKEMMCTCPKGFKGSRCDSKDVTDARLASTLRNALAKTRLCIYRDNTVYPC